MISEPNRKNHKSIVRLRPRGRLQVDGCYGFDNVDQNNSYALVGQYLQQAAAKRGTGPVVYHPSNLGFRYPRQFHELVSIGNQWRWFNDVQVRIDLS